MLEIAEADIVRSMRQDNPWWDDKYSFDEMRFSRERAYLRPFSQLALNWKIRRAVILMGPRRVGKTVMLQQLIAMACRTGFSPQNILFASIDTPLYSGMHLEKLIQLFEKITDSGADDKRIVVFDEIQYLKDWEKHLKVLTDKYPNTRFIASGSAAAALRLKSQESGAGRFTNFFLPPLTFAEFLDFIDVESSLIQLGSGEATRRFTTSNIEELNRHFIDYLNYGGYPEAVLNEEIRSNVQRYLGRDIIDKVLLRDLPSLYGIQDIQELNRLFTTIAYHTSQEISLESLASSSGVAKNTISRYLEYLEAAFLIVRVRRVDDTGKTFQRTRQFKAYLTNPSMRAGLFAPITESDDAVGAMVETAIFSQWFHSEDMSTIYYARWKSGRKDREVDLVRVDPGRLKPSWAYEVKWSDRYYKYPEELDGLIEFAKKGKGVPAGASTKTSSGETEASGVRIQHFPSALHCYQIGRNLIDGLPP